MKQQIATTQKQTDRLLKCGIPVESADFARYEDDSVSMMEWDWSTGSYGGTYPAWSLSALLTKVLPSDVDLRMLKLGTGAFNKANAWIIMYSADLYVEHSDIIEACVLMAEKLVSNGYKLNEQ